MSKDRATDTRTASQHEWHARKKYMSALLALICIFLTTLQPAHAQENGLPPNWREDKALLEYASKHTTARIMEGCRLLVAHQFNIETLPKDSEWTTCAVMLQMLRTMSGTFQPLDSPATGISICLPDNADVLKIADKAAKMAQAGPKVFGNMDSTKILIIAAGSTYPCDKSKLIPQAIKEPAGG